MKTLERNFKKIEANNPYWSTYTCFAQAIKGKSFNKETIRRWFNKLVNRDDYSSEDKKTILSFLYDLSWPKKVAEDDVKKPSMDLRPHISEPLKPEMRHYISSKHFDGCNAPLCPLVEESKEAVWYPDEEVCNHRPFIKWQKTQKKIARLFRKGMVDVNGYFTIESLTNIKLVRPGIKGSSP